MALGAFIFWQRGMLADYRSGWLALLFVAFALAGALSVWTLARLLKVDVSAASLARCTSTILPGETAVLAEVKASETARVLATLRDVEAEAPVTFAFHSPQLFDLNQAHDRSVTNSLGSAASRKCGALAGAIPVDAKRSRVAHLFCAGCARSSTRWNGERKPNHVSRGAPRLYPFGGATAR
jgi:hypothetical protein